MMDLKVFDRPLDLCLQRYGEHREERNAREEEIEKGLRGAGCRTLNRERRVPPVGLHERRFTNDDRRVWFSALQFWRGGRDSAR